MTPREQNECLGFIEALGGLSKLGTVMPIANRIARLLERQYYGLTGMLPRATKLLESERLSEMRRLGVGVPGASQELQKAQRSGENVETALARLRAAEEGLEHLPGFLRGLLKKPRKTLSLGWKAHSPVGKFVILSSPIIPAYGAISGTDLRPGETVPGRIGEEAARTLVLGATGALPAIPSIGAAVAAGKASKGLLGSFFEE